MEPSMNKPSFIRTFLLKFVSGWRRVMDVKYNPLKYVPDPSLQTYFMLVLFIIWSVYFGFLASTYLGWFGYNIVVSIVIHIAILLPMAFTNAPTTTAFKGVIASLHARNAACATIVNVANGAAIDLI